MKKTLVIGLLFAALGLVTQTASAATLSWAELGFKSSADGTVYDNPYGTWPPPSASFASFDTSTGLGSIKFTFSGAGSHYVVGFFDYQFVDQPLNNGIDDEYGVAHGSPAAGVSYSSDDPWTTGIYSAFSAFDGATPLDDTMHIGPAALGDVSVALGYAFTLGAGGPLDVIFSVTRTAPTSGFYIEHADPKSGGAVYFSVSTKTGGGGSAPEPASIALLGLGLAAAGRRLRRR